MLFCYLVLENSLNGIKLSSLKYSYESVIAILNLSRILGSLLKLMLDTLKLTHNNSCSNEIHHNQVLYNGKINID
jgi:hypothetical protein